MIAFLFNQQKNTSLRRMDLYILPVGPQKTETKIPTWHAGAAGLMADRQGAMLGIELRRTEMMGTSLIQ